MAKKQQGPATPTPATPVVGRDSHQRLSYLYQASVLLASVLPPTRPARSRARAKGKGRAVEDKNAEGEQDQGQGSSKTAQEGEGKPSRKRRRRQKGTSEALKPVSRHLAKQMVEVAKKATVRMDPTVKRTKCRGCRAVLVAGVTSRRPDLTPTSSSPPASPVTLSVVSLLLLNFLRLHLLPAPTPRQGNEVEGRNEYGET
ncbi:hypothetical protein JCM8547_008226 [Rhodosporidiobolus lusitaniae]